MQELRKGREMDQGALWQAPFPIGSSGSMPGSAEGREAMPGTGTRDENTGNASPLDWLRKVLQPLQPPAVTGVSAGRTFPAPLLVPRPKLVSHGRGPPTGKNQPPGEKKSQEAMELLDKMLSELEKRREMDREAVLKAVVPKEINDSLPESPEGRKAMPGTSKPDVVGKAGTKDQKPQSIRRVLCPQDVRKHCMVGTVVVLFTVPLAMILCYVGIRWWIDSKEHPKHQPGLRRSPSPPESPRNVHLDTSRRGAQHQQSHRKPEPQPSVPPPRPPPVPQPRRQDLPDIPLPPPPPPPPPPPSLLT
ncbi:prophenin and tritrpticin precursor-like isoform X2 [Chiroxiphia lanceolata]|uniref:prophenin and tritrpticin precursor-like isoform X2 n=1 Tax=Chiroxiphia lanceolata TaxID=296741 RepID=UPI0013CE66CB|nr:prophenin and tritrpticin precursor-like isoform X2 [Chiroxiphia lanceolata]